MAKLRGAADSVALRLRHHDDAIHAARSPGRREAKDVYDALEQARVEVVGSPAHGRASPPICGRGCTRSARPRASTA